MRRARVSALLAALAVGLTACGEKDESTATEPLAQEPQETETDGGGTDITAEEGGGGSGPSAEKQVEETVVAVVGGGNSALACNELVTPAYLRDAYGDEQGCRAAVSQQDRVDVAVEQIEIAGATATARAVPAAGPNRGETLRVELVHEAGAWRVDSLRSNAPAGP